MKNAEKKRERQIVLSHARELLVDFDYSLHRLWAFKNASSCEDVETVMLHMSQIAYMLKNRASSGSNAKKITQDNTKVDVSFIERD